MKRIIGKSPFTTISGLILAGLIAAEPFVTTGHANPWKVAIAVGIAVLGRLSSDEKKQQQ